MTNSPQQQPQQKVLSEAMVAEVLARASELDQLRASGTAVADLRTAATEAGITADSFDAALAELQNRTPAQGRMARNRSQWRTRAIIATTVLVLLAAMAMLKVVTPRRTMSDIHVAPPRLIDETIVLQCLTPDEAAELIRPVLNLRENRVVIRPTQNTRLLALSATAVQLQQVKTLLAPYEAAGSPTCATRPAR